MASKMDFFAMALMANEKSSSIQDKIKVLEEVVFATNRHEYTEDYDTKRTFSVHIPTDAIRIWILNTERIWIWQRTAIN